MTHLPWLTFHNQNRAIRCQSLQRDTISNCPHICLLCFGTFCCNDSVWMLRHRPLNIWLYLFMQQFVRKFWKRATKLCVLSVKLMCVRKDGGDKWKKFIKEEKICSWAVLTSCLIIITFQRGGKIFHQFPSLLSKLVLKLVSWKHLNAIISSEGIFVGNVFFNSLPLKPHDTEWLEWMIC